MFVTRRAARLSAYLLVAWSSLSCGARTAVLTDEGTSEPTPCVTDGDCASGDACAPMQCREGTCVALPAVSCDDHDECTSDRCDPETGQCLFSPTTLDLDGDGHRSPKPGFAPGAPGSCGDDCDDRSAAALPGGREICDGLDNDCNGKVDDDAVYNSVGSPVRVSSTRFDRAASAGLAFDGTHYGATFSGHQQRSNSFFVPLSRTGMSEAAETALTDLNSETYAGPLLHNGSYFESAWSDPRQDANYEVYFNRYDSNGKKLGPDLRVSRAPNFSLNARLAWNGTETLLVWDDRRFEQPGSNDIRLFGQRIAFDGTLIGQNVPLTSSGTQAESPAIALGKKRVGIVYSSAVTPTVVHLKFFTTAPDFTEPSSTVDVGATDVEEPSLIAVGDRFVLAWQEKGQSYAPSIYGAVLDESGKVLVPQQPITVGAKFARTFSLVSLGDRVVLVWVDDHDGNYELYEQILDQNLSVVSPRMRLSFSPTDTLSPIAALGPNGDLGVLYDDWQSGQHQSYFVSASCHMNLLPVP